jgi:hypothetical protein
VKLRIIHASLVVLALSVPAGAQVAPVADDDDAASSRFYQSLSPGPVPRPPSRSSNAPRQPRDGSMQPDKDGSASIPSYLNIIIDEPKEDGASSSPERSPRRAAPAVPPKPVDRTAAMPPKPEPLPKPRPDAHIEAVSLPSLLPAESRRQPASVPMPPIPPRSGDASPPSKPVDRTAAVPPKPEPLPAAHIEAVSLPSSLPAESKRQPASVPMPPIPPRSGDASPPSKPVDRTAAVPPKPEPLPKPRPDANIEAAPLPSPTPPAVSTRRPVSAPTPLTPPILSNAAPQPRDGTKQPSKSANASTPSAPTVIMADPDPDDTLPALENASGNDLHSPR